MVMAMHKQRLKLLSCLLLLPFVQIQATDRIPDTVFYQGEMYNIFNNFPMDIFLADKNLYPRHINAPMMVTHRGQMDGTNNPNFHIANWIIQDRQLYLADIEGYVYPDFNAWYLESIEKSLEAATNDDERAHLRAEIQSLLKNRINRIVIRAMDHFFPNRKPGQLIRAEWFSGQLVLEKQAFEAFPSKRLTAFELTFHQGVLRSVRRN